MAGDVFDEAQRQWLAGDAEGVLVLCERLPAREALSAPAVLLRARALLRLRRMRQTIALLESLEPARESAADRATAAMLLGTAYVRGGDVERGLAVLGEAGGLAPAGDVAVRSEIALGTALAHYQLRDFDGAAQALDAVDPASGIVYARALECRGWIAKTKNDFPTTVAAFEASLTALASAGQSDRFLEANLIATLSYVAVELLDLARCDALFERGRSVRWESSGLEYYRFWLEMNRSMADEASGRPREALQAARNAALYAPSDAFRVFAQCRRAAVLFAYGELLGFEDLAAAISADFGAIDLRVLHEFEEINLPVVVAETLALIGDGPGAAAALGKLDTMSRAQLALLHDEPMKRAYFAFVEGLVADANNDALLARHRYRDALRTFATIGMTRRALLTALRLYALHADDELLAFIRAQAHELPTASWIREHASRLTAWRNDPVLAELTRAEREVLELLFAGKSTAEIAAVRARSAQTIRNTVSKLLRTFAVDNRQALLNACARRGAFPTGTSTEPAPDSGSA
jgi:DNA-binding CsgD family transcriptional regulator